MLTAVKNQFKVTMVSVKYALMREMLNKTTFLMNIIFMILNNASFIIQWVIIYSLKSDVGGYSFNQILLLWGMAASTFGFSRFFFKKAFSLSDAITNGKLDAYLVQPKNVLLSAITSDVEASAIGDLIYAFIVLVISGITLKKFLLFIAFTILGGIAMTSLAVIFASLSFWFQKSDIIADTGNNLLIHFATYPEGIFDTMTRFVLYIIIPAGIINYIPVSVMTNFSLKLTLLSIAITIGVTAIAFMLFYRGLRRYSSSNLMMAKI